MIKNAERYVIIFLLTFFYLIFRRVVHFDELQFFSFSFSSFSLFFLDHQPIWLAFIVRLPLFIYILLEALHLVSESVRVPICTSVRIPILWNFSKIIRCLCDKTNQTEVS